MSNDALGLETVKAIREAVKEALMESQTLQTQVQQDVVRTTLGTVIDQWPKNLGEIKTLLQNLDRKVDAILDRLPQPESKA